MTTRALVVGSVAATGLFSSLAAWAQPGRSKAVRAITPTSGSAVGGQLGFRSRVGTGTSPTTTPATTPPTQAPSGGDDNLTQPTSPPVTSPPVTAPAYQYSPPVQYAPPVVVSGAS